MQTFLPYENFDRTAQILDKKRLGKQRVETLTILKTLYINGGWKNHPAVKMWKGYEGALLLYQESICQEWIKRGYKDSCLEKSYEIFYNHFSNDYSMPWWLGDERLHNSHKSKLLSKFPEHYKQYFVDVPDNLSYFWPINK